MAYKIIVEEVKMGNSLPNQHINYEIVDGSNSNAYVQNNEFDLDLSSITDEASYDLAIVTAVIADALSAYSITVDPANVILQGRSIRSFANPSRSLNSAFQISTVRDALVSYTIDIAATISLTSGQTGTVTLKYADDSGMTTNVVTVQSSVNGNTGTLTLGLNLTQTATAAVGGVIPAGKYVKLVTANTVGTPSFTMRAAQEVLL